MFVGINSIRFKSVLKLQCHGLSPVRSDWCWPLLVICCCPDLPPTRVIIFTDCCQSTARRLLLDVLRPYFTPHLMQQMLDVLSPTSDETGVGPLRYVLLYSALFSLSSPLFAGFLLPFSSPCTVFPLLILLFSCSQLWYVIHLCCR